MISKISISMMISLLHSWSILCIISQSSASQIPLIHNILQSINNEEIKTYHTGPTFAPADVANNIKGEKVYSQASDD